MGNVLAIDQLGLDRVPQTGGAQGFLGALAIGRVPGVGDGDAGYSCIGQAGQRHLAGVHGGTPQHDAAHRVRPDLRSGKPGFGQRTRKSDVGRKVQVVGRAPLDLRVKLARRAVDDVHLVGAVGLLKGGDDLVHGELQIGSGRNGDLSGMGEGRKKHGAGQQQGAKKRHGRKHTARTRAHPCTGHHHPTETGLSIRPGPFQAKTASSAYT